MTVAHRGSSFKVLPTYDGYGEWLQVDGACDRLNAAGGTVARFRIDSERARLVRTWEGDVYFAIALVYNQKLAPVGGDERLCCHIARVDRRLHQLIAGMERILNELEHPEARVGLVRGPIHHADTGILSRIANQLRFADDVDLHSRELDE